MRQRKHYVRPDGPSSRASNEELRELGRRLFDEITIERMDDQAESDAKDLEDGGCSPPAS